MDKYLLEWYNTTKAIAFVVSEELRSGQCPSCCGCSNRISSLIEKAIAFVVFCIKRPGEGL